jgi:hypothetical protein
MERREALKNIGFGSAALFSSSVLFGALQSCTSVPEVNWVPTFFSPEEAAQIEKICEGICPKTSTPGAIEAGVPAHLDAAMKVIENDPEANLMKKGMAVFVQNFDAHQQISIYEVTSSQMTDVINDYFLRYNEDEEILKNMRESMAANQGEGMSEDLLEAFFITQIVDSTFWSYFTSELVGEQVMRYDPVPVNYNGCIPYEAGTKSWSSV